MNPFNELSTYIVTLAIAAFIPGPGMLGLLFKTLAKHYRNSLFMLLGLITGDLIYLALALSGLSVLAHFMSDELNLLLMVLACIYLFYIAIKLSTVKYSQMQQPHIFNTDLASSTSIKSRKVDSKDYLTGLALTLSNPKTITFYLALVPSIFGTQFSISLSFLALIIFSTVLSLTFVGCIYIFSAYKIKRLLENPHSYYVLMKTFSLIVLAIAALLMWTQVIDPFVNLRYFKNLETIQ